MIRKVLGYLLFVPITLAMAVSVTLFLAAVEYGPVAGPFAGDPWTQLAQSFFLLGACVALGLVSRRLITERRH